MSNSNWIAGQPTVKESDIIGLKKAHSIEKKLTEKGWRFFKINNRIRILVPFGKNGKPTKEGMKMAEVYRSRL